MTRIKICGITNVDDARCAAQAGTDFLGFIFYAQSPRFVTPERAAAIVRAIQDEFGASAPRFVGVFVDEPVERVQAVLESARLNLAQLHGNEPPAQLQALGSCAFKAVRPRTLADAEAALTNYRSVFADDSDLPQLLADAYHPQQLGGTGVRADPVVACWLACRVRLLLAGGLTPEAVGPAIAQVRPWGVDVSSGVEAFKGKKDHDRVRDFIEAVRTADADLDSLPAT